MKEQKIRFTPIPSTAEVEAERERLAYRSRYMRVLRSTVYTLLVVAAVAVLLATLFLPVLQVSGDSMNPTLQDRDIILLVKGSDMKTGDLCGFYWQNKLLLKRIIGLPGETIEIREGTVYIDGEPIAETYLTRVDDQSMDPITLAKDEIFVMGDNRPVSRDSRAVGPLTLDEIYGRVLFVAFPFNEIRSTMALPKY